MAAVGARKRAHKASSHDMGNRERRKKPFRRQKEYHSDSDDDNETPDFPAVDLLHDDDDNNEDLENISVDPIASPRSSAGSGSGSDSDLDSSPDILKKKPQPPRKTPSLAVSPSSTDSIDGSNLPTDSDSGSGSDTSHPTSSRSKKPSTSKRNDPTAFATSLSKILNTKLTTARRTDPLLARSADAQAAARQVANAALEAKARRKMRLEKQAALEKGRVRNVLVPTRAKNETEEGEVVETMAELMETERRLRKTAQRGVVKLFNAVRAAQVKAAEAERASGPMSALGRKKHEVTEMSRKGFLELIAGVGGVLKKDGLEEA